LEDFFSSKHQVNPLNTEYEQESTLNYLKVVKQVSDECFRLELSLGPVFFVHCRYLSLCNPQKFEIGYVFSEEELNELFFASFAFAAEMEAKNYLARAEHSRYMLKIKLQKKNLDLQGIESALDYLEQSNILSDERFACAWLHNRVIQHAEGKTKLLAELLSRGIAKNTALQALEALFSEHTEEDLLVRAMEKYKRLGYSEDKITRGLLNKGFSYSMIKRLLKSTV